MLNKLVFENLRQRPVRTCLSVLAIGVEVTMILTLVGISYGTLDETARRARGVGADILVRPPASSVRAGSICSVLRRVVPPPGPAEFNRALRASIPPSATLGVLMIGYGAVWIVLSYIVHHVDRDLFATQLLTPASSPPRPRYCQ